MSDWRDNIGQPPKAVQADRAAARHVAIEKVAEFLQQNYPCDCEQDCGFPNHDEAAAIVEMVEAQFFPDDDPVIVETWL